MSIRLRLTLIYTVILTLALVAFGVIVYRAQEQDTVNFEVVRLVQMAERMAAMRSPDWDPPESEVDDRRNDGPLEDSEFRKPIGYLQVISVSGELIEMSESLSEPMPLSDGGWIALLNLETHHEVMTIDGERVLIVSAPVVEDGHLIEIVQMGESLYVRDQSLRALATTLMIGGGATLLVAFGLGWWLAGLALRPVRQMTEAAQEIGESRDLTQRVSHSGPEDEVGELAVTLNRMLAELEQSALQMEETLQKQQRFVADVSHELRTPLTTINGNLALLRREPPIDDEDRREILSDTTAESDRLIRLVRDLLALARADARAVPDVSPVPLGPLLQEMCRQSRQLDPDREIICAPYVEAQVLCGADALRQVLLILLDNGLQYTDGKIWVTAEPWGDQVRISVRDEGPGIPSEDLARIFERFHRAVRDDHTAGSGLGLAIAKALVESQGGTISVESQAGVGTKFVVSLPLA